MHDNPQLERIHLVSTTIDTAASKPYQKKQFQFPVDGRRPAGCEHERYLVEKHFKKPVIVTGYPAEYSKAFSCA